MSLSQSFLAVRSQKCRSPYLTPVLLIFLLLPNLPPDTRPLLSGTLRPPRDHTDVRWHLRRMWVRPILWPKMWLCLVGFKSKFCENNIQTQKKNVNCLKFHSSGFCCSTNIMLLGEMLSREFQFKLIQEMLLSWNWVLDSPNWKFRVLQLPTVWLIEIVQMLSVCSCTRCTVQGVHLTNYCVM